MVGENAAPAMLSGIFPCQPLARPRGTLLWRMSPMHRQSSRISVFLVFSVLVATAPRGAFAQPVAEGPPLGAAAVDEEKRLGDDAMVALRYEEALAHYRRAYEANKNPALLYNMGRAYEGLSEFPKALDALEEFSAKAPPALKARVPKLEALLNDIRNRVATVIVSSPVSGAEIRLGNKMVGTTRQGQTILRVNAGAQTMSVSHPDYFPFERPLALAAGKIETVDAALASRSAGALLVVTSPIAGAEVAIDGTTIGNVPSETGVTPGEHRIALQRTGYDAAERSVVVVAGERRVINVPMSVHETITGKWWFWTGIGVVAAAGAALAIIAATTEKSASSGTIPPGTVKAEGWGIRF